MRKILLYPPKITSIGRILCLFTPRPVGITPEKRVLKPRFFRSRLPGVIPPGRGVYRRSIRPIDVILGGYKIISYII